MFRRFHDEGLTESSFLFACPRSRPGYTMCEAGHRSSLVASLLKRAGFADVMNVSEGMTPGALARKRFLTGPNRLVHQCR
jgi:rhodanese-related sulfurtransferase